MKIIGSILMSVALLGAMPVAAKAPSAIAVPSVPVSEDGLVGAWFSASTGGRAAAIIVLGGSEGGLDGAKRIAAKFAGRGYGVLALAYFKADGLPPVLEDIPLDYFSHALDWLKRRDDVDSDRIGLFGISIGAETALVVASRHPEIEAVVAAVPSSVVWQGYDPADYRKVESTFTDHGAPVPYLPYDTSAAFTGVYDLYARSLAHRAEHPAAVIPVERIGGAVLLLSARDDRIWPSTPMAEQIMARLGAHHFSHPHRHVAFDDAGHGALLPRDDDTSTSAYDNLGGTPAGNAAARTAAWPAMIGFFDRYLGKPAA